MATQDSNMADEAPTSKACTRCGVVKLIVDFPRSKTGRHGVGAQCKKCKNAISAKFRLDNPEKIKDRHAKYREKNHEKLKLWQRSYKLENKDKVKDVNTKWKLDNPEKVKANRDKFYALHPEKIFFGIEKWRSENTGKVINAKKKQRDGLSRSYVSSLLRLHVGQAPPKLLELQRAKITLLRATNQLKKEMKNVK